MKRHILVMLVIALLVTLAVPPKLAVAQDVTGLMIYAFCDYNANGMFDKKDAAAKNKVVLFTAVGGIEGLQFTPGVWVEKVTDKNGTLLFSGLWDKLKGPVVAAQVPTAKAKRLIDTQMLFLIDYKADYFEMPLQTCTAAG